MEKEEGQKREWAQAQEIKVSVNLVEAAKKHLQFLAAVDRCRYLYDGPALDRAIYRYNAYWLPLLAKHTETPVSEGPLVVPLDCEWIWHCHRLNPLRYKLDCEKLFGKILDNSNVVSSVQGASKSSTEKIWRAMYPEEPYHLDVNKPFDCQDTSPGEKFTSYDLVSAVKRQVPFTYQVSRPHFSDDVFLKEAVARYKGFLHLIRTNMKQKIRRFCVPTYDVDLIWHTHQLHPAAYCSDVTELVGKVLQHDDTDSDRSKGKKLDTGFTETTRQWEETYGFRYWKAGAMHRGVAPSPVTHTPLPFTFEGKKIDATTNCDSLLQFPAVKSVEVLLEFVEIKNLDNHKGDVLVLFSKKQPDMLFNIKRTLSILSESGKKQVASFQCEATGELLFEVIQRSPSEIPSVKPFKSLGSCSLSLQDYLASASQLSFDKWLTVVPVSVKGSSAPPILLHIYVSFTVPTAATQEFRLVQSNSSFNNACFLPLSGSGKIQHSKSWTPVVDDDGNVVISLQMRDLRKNKAESTPQFLKEVCSITKSGEMHTLAQFAGNEWFLKGSHGSFELHMNSESNGPLFELAGQKVVKLYSGRRLDYESKQCEKKRNDQDCVTVVEFSADYPYGRAIALIDFKSGTFKVKDEWMFLPGITLTFILADILKREGYGAFSATGVDRRNGEVQKSTTPLNEESIREAKVEVLGGRCFHISGGCGSKCGSGCRNAISSGAECGGECGTECGPACESFAECGGNCVSCANVTGVVDKGSFGECGGECGTECGPACGIMAKSGACVGGCFFYANATGVVGKGSFAECGGQCVSCADVTGVVDKGSFGECAGGDCVPCAAVTGVVDTQKVESSVVNEPVPA